MSESRVPTGDVPEMETVPDSYEGDDASELANRREEEALVGATRASGYCPLCAHCRRRKRAAERVANARERAEGMVNRAREVGERVALRESEKAERAKERAATAKEMRESRDGRVREVMLRNDGFLEDSARELGISVRTLCRWLDGMENVVRRKQGGRRWDEAQRMEVGARVSGRKRAEG